MSKKLYDLSWLNEQSYFLHLTRVVEKLISRLEDNLQGILIFGSLAKGRVAYNTEHQSDIDLLIVAQTLPPNILARAKQDWEILGIEGLGIHAIWHTVAELESLVNAHRAFTFEILRDGKIVYDPTGILKRLKINVQELIAQLHVTETDTAWVWPQKEPGSEIEW